MIAILSELGAKHGCESRKRNYLWLQSYFFAIGKDWNDVYFVQSYLDLNFGNWMIIIRECRSMWFLEKVWKQPLVKMSYLSSKIILLPDWWNAWFLVEHVIEFSLQFCMVTFYNVFIQEYESILDERVPILCWEIRF